VAAVLGDAETYSSAVVEESDGTRHGGTMIPTPPAFIQQIPAETDAPEWADYRRPLVARFSPAAVEGMRPAIDEITSRTIDAIIGSGSCDLVYDIANPIPSAAMFHALGLPLDEWAPFAVHFHNAIAAAPGSEEFIAAGEGLTVFVEKLYAEVQERRSSPGSDIISEIVGLTICGRPITDQESVSIVFTLTLAGVDTSTMLLSNAFAFLNDRPAQRAWLLEDRKNMRLATEEFLRWSSPGQALARTVMRVAELGGQRLEPGDRVLVYHASANRDESKFEKADECVLDRYPNRHVGFGVGPHRCLGSHLARAEFESVMSEVLRRMPDYEIDMSKASKYPNLGAVNGWVQLPATFTPELSFVGS